MKALYYDTPNAAVAVNFKAGSATLARAIISAYHPGVETLITTVHGDGRGTAYPEGLQVNDVRWHAQCPKVNPQERPHVVVALRDPVERFRSACAESAITDVDAILNGLETDGFGRNVHFWPQSRLVEEGYRLYRFPDYLDKMAEDLGLALPLPNVPTRGIEKPVLSPEQEGRILSIYAEDRKLFDYTTRAGKPYRVPLSDGQVDGRRKALINQARRLRRDLEEGGFLFQGKRIPSDRESQAMITGAVVAAQTDPAFTTYWQVSPEEFIQLDAAAIEELGKALRDHVSSAFSEQANRVSQILAAQSREDLETIENSYKLP